MSEQKTGSVRERCRLQACKVCSSCVYGAHACAGTVQCPGTDQVFACSCCALPADSVCQWYAMCVNGAAGVVLHPVLGLVPTCGRCADRHALVFAGVAA